MSRTNVSATWNALIRTHHITSPRKVARLRQACSKHGLFVLLKSGTPPGIMYVEGSRDGVEAWVTMVKSLRYKDYQLASRPAVVQREADDKPHNPVSAGFFETGSVKDFGLQMDQRGVLNLWRVAMGYTSQGERL